MNKKNLVLAGLAGIFATAAGLMLRKRYKDLMEDIDVVDEIEGEDHPEEDLYDICNKLILNFNKVKAEVYKRKVESFEDVVKGNKILNVITIKKEDITIIKTTSVKTTAIVEPFMIYTVMIGARLANLVWIGEDKCPLSDAKETDIVLGLELGKIPSKFVPESLENLPTFCICCADICSTTISSGPIKSCINIPSYGKVDGTIVNAVTREEFDELKKYISDMKKDRSCGS